MNKYSVYSGGGATFYLITARTGLPLDIFAESKKEAADKVKKLIDTGVADWALSDTPEVNDDELIIDEVD